MSRGALSNTNLSLVGILTIVSIVSLSVYGYPSEAATGEREEVAGESGS